MDLAAGQNRMGLSVRWVSPPTNPTADGSFFALILPPPNHASAQVPAFPRRDTPAVPVAPPETNQGGPGEGPP